MTPVEEKFSKIDRPYEARYAAVGGANTSEWLSHRE
jgi:hypothetical protein